MHFAFLLVVGLVVGILVGLMGIGGGVVLVPAFVYLFGMNQHLAQGTSLFILLPPLGLGALLRYRKRGDVDLLAGLLCAAGFLAGGYWGGFLAVHMRSQILEILFGFFMILTAGILFRKNSGVKSRKNSTFDGWYKLAGIFLAACFAGVLSGLFGVGGGVLLVPLLVLLFAFEEHKAQGTSLVALVPPTGLLAFLAYYHAHEVNFEAGLLIMPGVFFGGLVGSDMAEKFSAERMRRIFAIFVLVLGIAAVISTWAK